MIVLRDPKRDSSIGHFGIQGTKEELMAFYTYCDLLGITLKESIEEDKRIRNCLDYELWMKAWKNTIFVMNPKLTENKLKELVTEFNHIYS